jgi:hypothetical protein
VVDGHLADSLDATNAKMAPNAYKKYQLVLFLPRSLLKVTSSVAGFSYPQEFRGLVGN